MTFVMPRNAMRNMPLAAKQKGRVNGRRASGRKNGPANGRSSAEKRQVIPQLPGHKAGHWRYGGKQHGGKQVCQACYHNHGVRLVKGVRVR